MYPIGFSCEIYDAREREDMSTWSVIAGRGSRRELATIIYDIGSNLRRAIRSGQLEIRA